jgi:hypothetical protein
LCYTISNRVYIIGGKHISNNCASSNVFEINTSNVTHALKKKPMHHRRYGHCGTSIKGNIYVIGGYSHKDEPGENP